MENPDHSKRWRQRFLAYFFGAMSSLGALAEPAVVKADLYTWQHVVFRANHCVITAVHQSDQVINVEFTGRWDSFPSSSNSIQNGFCISRQPAIPQKTWEFLAARFRKRIGRAADIEIIPGSGYAIRGGVPIFNFPASSFELASLVKR